jgi:hypothetical protein
LLPNPAQYNVIAYGLQECPRDLRRTCFEELRSYLFSFGFVDVDFTEMWELMLCVFVRRTDVPYLHSRSQNIIALGFAGYVGNKGGLNIQFCLHEYTFSFINCHLTHGALSEQDRLDMMAEILKKVHPKITRSTHRTETDSLCDFNFIIGDMNSRFLRTYNEHIKDVKNSAAMINMYDQLFIQQLKGHYPDYHEPKIEFMPTYKLDDFNNEVYVNKKNQCPSYTDRILYKCNTKC